MIYHVPRISAHHRHKNSTRPSNKRPLFDSLDRLLFEILSEKFKYKQEKAHVNVSHAQFSCYLIEQAFKQLCVPKVTICHIFEIIMQVLN